MNMYMMYHNITIMLHRGNKITIIYSEKMCVEEQVLRRSRFSHSLTKQFPDQIAQNDSKIQYNRRNFLDVA